MNYFVSRFLVFKNCLLGPFFYVFLLRPYFSQSASSESLCNVCDSHSNSTNDYGRIHRIHRLSDQISRPAMSTNLGEFIFLVYDILLVLPFVLQLLLSGIVSKLYLFFYFFRPISAKAIVTAMLKRKK
jgi:hypothetical protein